MSKKVAAEIPAGVVVMTAGQAAPTGWSLCDGTALSRAKYPNLFRALGTAYGIGDGSTTFNIPDFRGVFPKGAGTTNRAAGKDAAGNFYGVGRGQYMQDAFQGHRHPPLAPATSFWAAHVGVNFLDFGGEPGELIDTTGDSVTDTVNGPPRTAALTEPQHVGILFMIYLGIVNEDVYHG